MTSDAVNAEEGIASRLGRHMFERRCDLDGFDAGMVELAWLDSGTREFWRLEAEYALTFAADELEAILASQSADALRESNTAAGLMRAEDILRGDA